MKLKIISFTLLTVIIIVLIIATILEKISGTEVVVNSIYGSWWFVSLWAVECIVALIYIIRSKVYRHIATFLLHCSFVVILIGALITHIWGVQGSIHIRAGETTNAFVNSETKQIDMLPFTVSLKEFQLENYPGTQSAMDYISIVEISDNNKRESMRISMNNIGDYDSYRFYQSGYDPDMQGTYLSISHDPWGIGVTYTGYALLLLSMLLFLILPNEGFRRLLKGKTAKAIAMIAFFSTTSLNANAYDAHVLSKDIASQFGELYTYYNGRVCPVQTVAIDFTTKLYGKSSYKGYTAEQVLTGWIFFTTSWLEEPMIKVKGGQIEAYIGKSENYLSYSDFFNNSTYKLENVLKEIRTGKDVQNSRAIQEADEKMNILLMLFNGQMLKIYPFKAQDGSITWWSQGQNPPIEMGEDKYFFVKKSMDYVGELAVMEQYGELKNVLDKIHKYQVKEAGNALPSDTQFKAELLYNNYNYTKPLAMFLLTIGIVLFIVCIVLMMKGKKLPLWTNISLISVASLVVIYLLFIISLRSIVSGHLPLANGYETMQFMSLCSIILTFCLWKKSQLIPSFGYILAGLTLLVAMMGQANPQITPLMPVLSSPLLSIHVCVIMIAYTLFAFLMFNSVAALVMRNDNNQSSILNSQLMLVPALFLLTAGIFIGAIWANVSWGRYWGWDPKEVWALITMLIYAIPLHRQSIKWFKNPTHFHIYMILAFLSVIITYFGVNFFLGGMHSYANS